MKRKVEQYEVMPLEGEKVTYMIYCPSCDCQLGEWKTPTGSNTRKCSSCKIRWKLERKENPRTDCDPKYIAEVERIQ